MSENDQPGEPGNDQKDLTTAASGDSESKTQSEPSTPPASKTKAVQPPTPGGVIQPHEAGYDPTNPQKRHPDTFGALIQPGEPGFDPDDPTKRHVVEHMAVNLSPVSNDPQSPNYHPGANLPTSNWKATLAIGGSGPVVNLADEGAKVSFDGERLSGALRKLGEPRKSADRYALYAIGCHHGDVAVMNGLDADLAARLS